MSAFDTIRASQVRAFSTRDLRPFAAAVSEAMASIGSEVRRLSEQMQRTAANVARLNALAEANARTLRIADEHATRVRDARARLGWTYAEVGESIAAGIADAAVLIEGRR